MCMEDIRLGRSTPDMTHSLRQTASDTTTFVDLVIPANENRTGLRLFGQAFMSRTISESIQEYRYDAFVEIWIDNPITLVNPTTVEGTLLLCLTQHNPTELLRIETEGLLLQRRLIMRGIFDPLAVFASVDDFFLDMSWTEYVLKEEPKPKVNYGGLDRKPLPGNPAGLKPPGFQPPAYRKSGTSWP